MLFSGLILALVHNFPTLISASPLHGNDNSFAIQSSGTGQLIEDSQRYEGSQIPSILGHSQQEVDVSRLYGPPTIDLSSLTLLEIIKRSLEKPADDEHSLHIHKFAWLANFTSILDKEDSFKKEGVHGYLKYLEIAEEAGVDVTILAPDDEALSRHHKKNGQSSSFWSAEPTLDDLLEDLPNVQRHGFNFHKSLLDTKEDHPSIPHSLLKKLAAAVSISFSYSTLPKGLDTASLVDISTSTTYLPSYFVDGKLGDPIRVRFSTGLVPPRIKVNVFSHIRGPTIKAKNGERGPLQKVLSS
jgi:hypothetical protein